MKLRITWLPLLVTMCLALSALSASASDITLFSNGPANPNDLNAWMINFGNTVSDSFLIGSASTVTGFSVALWTENQNGHSYPPIGLDWSITSGPDSGTVWGSATLQSITTNLLWNHASPVCGQWTCDVWQATISFNLAVPLPAGTYWLNLSNARNQPGDPVWWEENDGNGCTGWNNTGQGCPSQAFLNGTTPIGSEDPDLFGQIDGTTPEPSSLLLFGSGMLAVGTVLRRRAK